MTKKYIILAPTDRRTNRCIGDYTLPLYSYQKMALNAWDWVIVFDSLDEAKQQLYPSEGTKDNLDEMTRWKLTCCVAECEVDGEGSDQRVMQISKLHYINWVTKRTEVSPRKRIHEVKRADWQEMIVTDRKISDELLQLLTEQLHKKKKPAVQSKVEAENQEHLEGSAGSVIWSVLGGVYMVLDAIATMRIHLPVISPAMAVLRYFWRRQTDPVLALPQPQLQQKTASAPQRLFAGNPKRQTKEAPLIKRDSITLTHF